MEKFGLIRRLIVWGRRRHAAIAMLISAAALALAVPATGKAESVQGAGGFSWNSQAAVIDFAEEHSNERFGALVEDAHEKTILYLDWTIHNAAVSGLFRSSDMEGGDSTTDAAICGYVEHHASQPGGLTLHGKPDPDDNHLLLVMTLDLARGAPFARARCEYEGSSLALRLRGFFYVTDIGTPTATKLEFQPVSVPAHRVPETFLEMLR